MPWSLTSLALFQQATSSWTQKRLRLHFAGTAPQSDADRACRWEETEPAEKRARAKSKGGKLGKPRLRSRRTPSASSLGRSDELAASSQETDASEVQGKHTKSGEKAANAPKRKQRKASASSGTSARRRKGSKPSRDEASEAQAEEAKRPKAAKSRSASRSLSNLSDTDQKKGPSRQRTSSIEFERTPSNTSVRRALSRETSGSSAGNRRVNSGNLSASSTRELGSPRSPGSPGAQTPRDARGHNRFRTGRMTPRRREQRRRRLRRRLAAASEQAPRRKDGKVNFLRKAWSQARTALLGLPEPETQDDNDPRAKGLRGWNAARALCIGTGRALQDSKRIMSIVRQAADEAYHRHCLQKAIINEIGTILRTSLAYVSDDMDETIGDILMDLQRLKMVDMTEVGALVCEAILNFEDGEDPETGAAEGEATQAECGNAPAVAAPTAGEVLPAAVLKRPTALQSLRDELWMHVHSMPNREDVTGMDDDEIEVHLDQIIDQVDDLRKQLFKTTCLSIGRHRRRSSLRESESRLSGIGVVDMPSDGRESVDSILSRLSGISRSRAASRATTSSDSEDESSPNKSPSAKPQLSSGWRSVQKLWSGGSLAAARAEEEPRHPGSTAPAGFDSIMSTETTSVSDPFANSTSRDESPRRVGKEELKLVDRRAQMTRLERQDTCDDDSEGQSLLGRSWGSTWSPPAKPPKLKVRGRSPGHSPSRERLQPQVSPVPVSTPSLLEVSQRSVLYAAMTAFPHMQKASAVVRSKKSAKHSVKEVSDGGSVLPSVFLPRPLSPNARRQGGG
ncbi:unnamed protein product [Symbiodinium pilosum]|uniref:Uncharacterized protein n=1 Tax=Symbiodinium pilosum TaxID=2952 RepID=A0A812JFH0_SYMPI|nr:unnamed protein product [Symbiodinium pilosum]